DFIHNLDENIMAENREEDKPWFEGIEARFKNKSSYMRYSCERRIRSYMREVQSHTETLDPVARDEYKKITEAMCNELKAVKYNGCYFGRMEQKANRLCTSEGWFSCQALTWNLDHVIEKQRTIIPCLSKAVKECNKREVNWQYFFNLLFTYQNLKLVHIVCHKKTSHNLSCDCSLIYKKRKALKRTLK
ncbi:hypothetical protein GDO86_012577, partial [Hymenochirus boettgeri]